METKYFSCSCIRCNDPTELGTHLSSFKCTKCRKGYIIFVKEKDAWRCTNCSHIFSKGLFNSILNCIQNLIEDIDQNNTKQVEDMITRLSKYLAPNHSYLIDLKQQLAVLYRNKNQTCESLNKRKKLCEELLSVIEVLEPGISRLRGMIFTFYLT